MDELAVGVLRSSLSDLESRLFAANKEVKYAQENLERLEMKAQILAGDVVAIKTSIEKLTGEWPTFKKSKSGE